MRAGLTIAVVVMLCGGAATAAELPSHAGLYPASGRALAMLDSEIVVEVRGPIAEVRVRQRFHNPSDQPTEATYIFPLPSDAAVTAMEIRYGARTVRAAIERREAAQRRYEDAVRRGVAAAVLDQERPDVFTQTVAAIPARGTVDVVLRYDTAAIPRGDGWELVVPLVVAPRYVPGTANARPTTGAGRAPDTNRAPDASRVTPPGAPGAGGRTEVSLRFADDVRTATSPTHELRALGGGRAYAFTDPASDHDAIVRWQPAVRSVGWIEPGSDGATAAVVVSAPLAAPLATSGPRAPVRCLLVLDRSAVTRGDAQAVARPLVRAWLAALGPADRVAVAGSDALAWAAPADVGRALDARWATPAPAFDLTAVLRAARPAGAPVIVVSSGLVADDRDAIAAARALGVPVHVVAVGPAPARGLLQAIAGETAGTERSAVPGDDLAALGRALAADVAAPPPALRVSWGALVVRDVVPATLPRLGAGQAVLVLARVDRGGPAANVRAYGELFAISTLPAPAAAAGAVTRAGPLARRWARGRLAALAGDREARVRHALRYGLVSADTSLVAIGSEVVVTGGVRRSIAVPVAAPAGMAWDQVQRQLDVDTRIASPAAPVGSQAAAERSGDAAPERSRDDADSAQAEDSALGTSTSGSLVIDAGAGRGWRVLAGLAGGADLADPTPLLALSLRVEVGARTLLGIGGTVWWVTDHPTQGRIYATLARRGVVRSLELGGGAGLHVGDGVGPAAALWLRAPLPPLPQLAGALRYDTALLDDGGTRRSPQVVTLGVELAW